MSFTIKNLSVTYYEINESNIFTNGDCISGHVTLEVMKETKINSFKIKATGKAHVSWSEHCGRLHRFYSDNEIYFKSAQYFIQDQKDEEQDGIPLLTDQDGQPYSNTVAPGCHLFPFTFHLPQEEMPPSFKGVHGKIVYFLEAKLTRSMRIPSKARTEFTFVSKPDPSYEAEPFVQQDFTEKKLKFFNNGSVSMNISIDNMEYPVGDGITVTGLIENNSSRPIRPKYFLYQKQSCFADKERKVNTRDILREEGDIIEPSTSTNVTKVLNIPFSIPPSVLTSDILKVEYRLRVYLDVKFALDPEIKFEVELLPPRQVTGWKPLSDSGSSSSEACRSNSQEEAYTVSFSDPPPPYSEYDVYPTSSDAPMKP
ncbi:arrestin domain-containing protein 3-like [Clupea harengus]|uniref:Arrestin domain-containing protein 3-like n=1 Tax=Clupea harengus TaxID=7950 RepID=A0A6P8FDG0_CLUHA|nr:arrestin domain-containing protein 3-like [Clupea harengus]